MGRLIVFCMVTADGYFDATDGNTSWHNADAEFNDFSLEQLQTVDTLLFGRKTFETMEAFWTSETAKNQYPELADVMNNTVKILASKVLKSVKWNKTEIFSEIWLLEGLKINKLSTKDTMILGSAELSATLAKHNFVDEYRLMVNPVVIGKGRPFFKNIKQQLNLSLVKVRLFNSGNVLLCYKPIPQP